MKLIWKYLNNYKSLLIFALILATINQIFSLLDPQVFRLIVDNYINKAFTLSRNDFISGVLFLLALSVGVALVSRIAKNFQDYYVNVITQRLGTKLYADSVAHAFSLPYQNFEDQKSGEILQKLQKARLDSQTLIAGMIGSLFLSIVGLLFVLIYASWVNWTIGLAFLILTPTLGAAIFFISGKVKQAQKNINAQMTALAGSTTETLRNVELVKSLGLENQEIKRLNEVNNDILKLELRKIRLVRTLSFIQGTAINASRALIMLLMLWLIYTRSITLGEFFSLFFYLFFIFGPLGELGALSSQYQEAKASMEQLDTILKMPSQAKPTNPIKLDDDLNIDFENITFTYVSGNEASIKEASLKITPGETVAFVGPSGSGKTTLVKLILGLYQPQAGKLTFNGIDSKKIDYNDLRNKIGLVSQETQLFAGSIRDNLLFAKPSASDGDCLEALEAASVSQIMQRGGKGLDTIIGEGGLKLSGGERQRLAIARALLRKPSLLIFDEATSSLDSITEKEISDTIKSLDKTSSKMITILVAHRLSTISHADKIYVLEKGKIIEVGKDDELKNLGGLYSALWREQMGVVI